MEDELLALEAIYSLPGEFSVLSRGDGLSTYTVISSCLTCNSDIQVTIRFSLPPAYPGTPPEISVSCSEMTKNDSLDIRDKLIREASTLVGNPMIMDLLTTARSLCDAIELDNSVNTNYKPPVTDDERHFTALLQIDHMRSKANYIKTIVSWTEELSLTGRLLFQGRLILVVLQGSQSSIKDYIVRQRTTKIDVDSKGHSCKERMMSILFQIPTEAIDDSFKEFDVTECESNEEVKQIFSSVGLLHALDQYTNVLQEK